MELNHEPREGSKKEDSNTIAQDDSSAKEYNYILCNNSYDGNQDTSLIIGKDSGTDLAKF